ncbi:MAG TPA: hypothetical protein VG944_09640, partial [Fimbriimonas sp.]|nr:hypothetical protein [Fimbriimonas sp.]
ENKSYQIGSLIQTGARQKMHTLDQNLSQLVERGLVAPDDARARAKDAGEFDRLLALNETARVQAAAAVVAKGDGELPKEASKPQGVRGQPNRPQFKRE